ncbi:cytochrome b [Roseibium sediminis]|uniref:cytochrome b n=1 Tax=Roseibium sediminis TaxID=1775174 RepID=UPI00123CBE28|nr:cytochrome b [Roseibium sediminis]
MFRNTKSGYGWISIGFHWVMALLMVGTLGLGIYMHDLPPSAPETFELYQLHKSFGFVILGLALLRLVWRSINPSPRLPDGMKNWERTLAHLGHAGLYAALFALPLTGWIMVSASPWGIPTVVFNTIHVPHFPVSDWTGNRDTVETLFQSLHEYMAWFTVLLLIGHVAAALKHHFILRDTTLRRMISTGPARSSK